MTLVVGGVSAGTAWMVSDTLITGGTIQLREHEYQVKCVTSKDRQALVAFSGDAHNGAQLIEQAADLPRGENVVQMLSEAQRNHPRIDFLYTYRDSGGSRLFKISGGTTEEVLATYIGEKDAFEKFQRIRHTSEIDPVPKTIEHFMFGTRAPSKIPDVVHSATVSMLRLFLQRGKCDVGGWAVPYVLVDEGTYMCGYAHSYSDPILDKVSPGSIIPHGTAEAGGYGLAVTELGEHEGMVIYRRQVPGGVILVRQAAGYKSLEISGDPREFREKARAALGKPVDIFFGDAPLGTPESITIVRDEKGRPAFAIAKRGQTLSFSILNVETVFKAKAPLDLVGEKGPSTVAAQNLTLTLADDSSHVILELLDDGKVVGKSTLSANELDKVIAGLGAFRAALPEQVSAEPDQSGGVRELLVVDPAWRTERSPHSDMEGILMRLRHIGLGWVSFLLPPKECRSLGQWLNNNCSQPAKLSDVRK